MSQRLRDYRVFWQEFRANFHTTGAILPSGRSLARALARHVGQADGPQRILEVGPGTGAVTAQIVKGLRSVDHFDLVELNDQFVANLRQRFASDPPFMAVSGQSRVLHQSVEQLESDEPYDLVISGLPLNNFSVEQVESILTGFRRLLRRGGLLSFFEYIAIRPARALVSGPSERARLRGIGRAMNELLEPYEIRRDCVWPNIPPAWVHHVRLPGVEDDKVTG
jgi:phospholipid N-methyltransferase